MNEETKIDLGEVIEKFNALGSDDAAMLRVAEEYLNHPAIFDTLGILRGLDGDTIEELKKVNPPIEEEGEDSDAPVAETDGSADVEIPEEIAALDKITDEKIEFVNNALKMATDGKLADISGVIKGAVADKTRIHALSKELDEANKKAAAGSGALAKLEKLEQDVASGKTVRYEYEEHEVGEEKIPTGRETMVNLRKVVKDKLGDDFAQLDFNVVGYEWDDVHPWVPEIEEGYRMRPEILLRISYAMENNYPMWAHGHSGTGKSSVMEQYCSLINKPVQRVNLDGNIERPDFVGNISLGVESGASHSYFNEGVLPRTMREPAMLILDEIDAGRPDIMYVVQSALEEGGRLRLTEDGGRIVEPNPGFRWAATANSVGQGDEFGMYPAVRAQSQAMLDRFRVWMKVDYLEKKAESQMLVDRCPGLTKQEAGKIVKFASEVRRAFVSGDIMQTLSPRGLLTIANYIVSHKDPLEAIEMTVCDRASQSDVGTIRGLAQRVYG